jgi:class 3 adenylate cyclase
VLILAATSVVALAALLLQVVRLRARTRTLERRLGRSQQALESLQQAFARFAPSEIVEGIIAQGIGTASEHKEVTVLFADLKGFTALAERLEPDRLVRLLNGYFAAMSEAIAAHRGHLAKFVGDGLLALFGALEPNPWQTNDAVHAALAMRAALAAYNATLAADGMPPIAAGIGIHRGPVVAGVIGTPALMEYGVIGRTVNVASRVEGLTRVHDTDILVTAAARAHLDPRFVLVPRPPVAVKGVPDPLATFDVAGFDGSGPGGAGAPPNAG